LNSRNVSLGYPVFSVGRAIKDLETGKMLGVMLIEIRGDVLTKELDSIQFGESGYVYLADARNRYMYHSDPSYYGKYVGVQLPQLPKEYLDDKRSHLILQEKLDNGWTVVGVVPVQELVADSKQIRDQTVMIVIISIVVAIAMGYYVSLNIGQPLVKLSRLMRLVEEGDLTVRAPVKGKNEIGYLSRSFNRMISQMDELIRRIGREEAEKKRIEIQALRYQINPHFLFNTLNSIRWLATFDKKDEVVNAVTTLVHLLEGSLQRNGPYVKLGEELDLLEKYIVIQQYRYDSRIRLQIGCAAELRDILVPRMILQPIVENSIFHGIAPKEAEGKIEIACEDLENDLVITIRDDGIGMDQEMIDHLLHRRSDQAVKGMTSIGLRHVHETLQLHYGKSYGLAVTSRKGEGTAVRLHLSKHPGG
jgi:two-component system sensor histidine kinase YesM